MNLEDALKVSAVLHTLDNDEIKIPKARRYFYEDINNNIEVGYWGRDKYIVAWIPVSRTTIKYAVDYHVYYDDNIPVTRNPWRYYGNKEFSSYIQKDDWEAL